MTGAVETIARFGADRSLVGIFTAPPGAAGGDGPAIVIPNTGIGHRGSHHRLFVIFARALAEAGYPVLRFDLSGLGDSAGRASSALRADVEGADLRAAIDWVTAAGHGTVMLLGLCSGADRSVVYAGDDARVRGLILIDPTIPPTLRYLGAMLLRRLAGITMAGVAAWLREWTRGAFAARERPVRVRRRGTGPAAALAWYRLPAYLEAVYARGIANGAAVLVLFTSGVQGRHSYDRRLADAFPGVDFADRLSVRTLDGVHHLFVLEREREMAIAAIRDWLALAPQGRHASHDSVIASAQRHGADLGQGTAEL